MGELQGQWILTFAGGNWGDYLQELLTEEGRGGRVQTVVSEISVLRDTGFQASSLASAGADVVAGGPQRFAAVVQVPEASGGRGQGPPLVLGQPRGRAQGWADLAGAGGRGSSDGWGTGGWWEGLMA